ncbi:MAG: hypothetical protein LBJ00_18005 [Planctomycetaceae bacterium]|nr:hypothetical protein [Planctomycetaceae bacterium]
MLKILGWDNMPQPIWADIYTQAVLKFLKLDTQAQQREAVVQGRSLSPYRLRYTCYVFVNRIDLEVYLWDLILSKLCAVLMTNFSLNLMNTTLILCLATKNIKVKNRVGKLPKKSTSG